MTVPRPDYLKESSASGSIMLAITGASGVGKSSMVNALRGVRDTDGDAAETGVKETTMQPQMYSFRHSQGLFDQRFYRSYEEKDELRPKSDVILQNVADEVDGSTAEVISSDGQVKVRLNGKVLEVSPEQAPRRFECLLHLLTSPRSTPKIPKASRGVLNELAFNHLERCFSFAQVAGVPLDVVVWDLPGAGTPSFPQATYLKLGPQRLVYHPQMHRSALLEA